MEEKKFELGQTVYSAQSYKIGRYVIKEKTTHETLEGITEEMVFVDPTGREVAYSVADVQNNFYFTLEEAKERAIEEWQVVKKTVEDQISSFTDEAFDEIADKIAKQKEAKGK